MNQRVRDNRRISADKTVPELGIILGSKECKNNLRLKRDKKYCNELEKFVDIWAKCLKEPDYNT
jgi:hypothetical protein